MDDNRLKGERIYDKKLLLKNISSLIKKSKKYNSTHTLLFHQSIFATEEIDYKGIYEEVIG
jgi:hypothetical protein